MAYIDNFDLNTDAIIKRRTFTQDGKGGGSYTNTIVASIKCAVWQASAGEAFVADRMHNPTTHFLACEPSSSYLAKDIVVIGSDTYSIVKPDNVRSFDELMIIGMELTG